MPKAIRGIGASKFATVSECQAPSGEPLALKQYNRLPLSRTQHQRVFAAAEQWQRLSIAALVPYLEVSPQDHSILMELYDRSVAIRIREGSSDPRLVLHAMRGILAALAQLHDRGLLHLNLKPTNVFFDASGRARLSDGWLLSAQSPESWPLPGNPKYLTPEQTNDSFGPLTPATDLYAVGFMALELLAGDRFHRAFQGIGDNVSADDPAWLQWHGSSQVAPNATLFARACQTELAAIIAKMVAKQPALRYASARQVLQDLPQDLSLPTQAATALPSAPASAGKCEAVSNHIVDRPATGIVLAIASGPRAGEMIGTNEHEFLLGFGHDCFIRFSSEQYPHGNGKVLLRRSSEGWYALRVAGEGTFINQHLLEEKRSLRTGDIVRLSSRGPDVQFTMQSGGVAVRALVNRFLPSQAKEANRPKPPGSLAGAVTPHAPVKSTPVTAAPVKPTPVKPTPVTAAPVRPLAVSPTLGETATGPSSAASLAYPAPAAPQPKTIAEPIAAEPLSKVPAEKRGGSRRRLKTLSIGLIGALLLILVAALLLNTFQSMPSRPAAPDSSNENSTVP